MGNYETEQGGEYGESTRLDTDLKPWLRREFGLDLFLDEFPYFQYAGEDFDPREDEKTRSWMEKDWTDDDPMNWTYQVAQKGPFRTDVVGVSIDRRALKTRIRRVGHSTSMNGSQQTKRRRRRTYLSFVGDGPMTREYWEGDHGSKDELPSYGEASASRGFGWLKKRRFLIPTGGPVWDAVDLPLHIHGNVHAFELKLTKGEWTTALEQASRADVFADYRWVVYDLATAPDGEEQLDRFRDAGVGLITVHPEDGADVVVWADKCTPSVDRQLLKRYNVERWDLNERTMKILDHRHEREVDPDKDVDQWYAGDPPPDILGQIDVGGLETDTSPPTVHGHRGDFGTDDPTATDGQPHKPLTAFGGEDDG